MVESPPLPGHPDPHPSYKDKHNPWAYYHATFDRQDYCDDHVVPMGYVDSTGKPQGQLVEDLKHVKTTTATDDHTVVVETDQPDPILLNEIQQQQRKLESLALGGASSN